MKAPAGYVSLVDFQAAVDCVNAHVDAMNLLVKDIEAAGKETAIFSQATSDKMKECVKLTRILRQRFGATVQDRIRGKELDS